MVTTLQEVRDTLLRENKFDAKKQPEERMAYANGVLDMYNEALKAEKCEQK